MPYKKTESKFIKLVYFAFFLTTILSPKKWNDKITPWETFNDSLFRKPSAMLKKIIIKYFKWMETLGARIFKSMCGALFIFHMKSKWLNGKWVRQKVIRIHWPSLVSKTKSRNNGIFFRAFVANYLTFKSEMNLECSNTHGKNGSWIL